MKNKESKKRTRLFGFMKFSKTTKQALIYELLIFFGALIGQRIGFSADLHAADPFIVLAAMSLPLPYAMAVTGIASVAVDLLKGYYLLAPVTLIVKLAMVLAVKGLLKTKPAQKHPELMASIALFIPVLGYYLGETVVLFIFGEGMSSFAIAASRTIKIDLLQAVGGVLVLYFLYDMISGIRAGKEEAARLRAEQSAETKSKENEE